MTHSPNTNPSNLKPILTCTNLTYLISNVTKWLGDLVNGFMCISVHLKFGNCVFVSFCESEIRQIYDFHLPKSMRQLIWSVIYVR